MAKKKEEKRKVGRPKLGDTKIKKESLAVISACLVIVLTLLFTGAYDLSITPKASRLKGEAGSSAEYNLGDKFCLKADNGKEECFYVIKENTENNTVIALAEYNLLVGYRLTFTTNYSIADPAEIDSNNPNYGLQDETAKGVMAFGEVAYGVVPTFSESNYWSDIDNYPAFVFDENSNLWDSIQNYQTYLRENLGKSSASVNLLSVGQAELAGCTFDDGNGSCENAPEWLKTTSFWLGDAGKSYTIFVISPAIEPVLGSDFFGVEYNAAPISGVRPVLTISKDDLVEPEEETEEEPSETSDKETPKSNDKVTTTKKAETTKAASKAVKSVITTKSTTAAKTEEKVEKLSNNITTTGSSNKKNLINKLFIIADIELVIIIIVEGILIYRNKRKKNK